MGPSRVLQETQLFLPTLKSTFSVDLKCSIWSLLCSRRISHLRPLKVQRWSHKWTSHFFWWLPVPFLWIYLLYYHGSWVWPDSLPRIRMVDPTFLNTEYPLVILCVYVEQSHHPLLIRMWLMTRSVRIVKNFRFNFIVTKMYWVNIWFVSKNNMFLCFSSWVYHLKCYGLLIRL